MRHGLWAGVPNCHPHRFRHTYALYRFREGMDPATVQKTLGHSDLTMTRRYMDVVDADVAEAKRLHSPLDRLKLRG